MADDTRDQAPDGVRHAVPAGDADDTEGHRRPPNVVSDGGPDGVRHTVPAGDDADDTEGHRRPPNVVSDDGPDGVFIRAVPDGDEATEV